MADGKRITWQERATWKELIEEAKRQGMNHFFTGKPCKRGHMSKRWVKNGMCVECDKEYHIKWRAENPEKFKESRRRRSDRWKAKHPEKHAEIHRRSSRNWIAANPERAREINRKACLKFIHKKKAEQFGVAYDPQPCEICGSSDKPGLDHDHATGKFRGWLCTRCNSVLGYVNDSVEHLQKMIAYLLKDR